MLLNTRKALALVLSSQVSFGAFGLFALASFSSHDHHVCLAFSLFFLLVSHI